jgi:zinc transport system substrate-binding protein
MRIATVPVLIATAAMLALAGCSGAGAGTDTSASEASDKPVVVTDIYPTTFAVQEVAGDAVEVVQLAPPGVEPHEYELSPRQVQQIADADLVAYLPGMVPAVKDAAEQEAAGKGLDVAEGITRLEGHAQEEEAGEHAEEADPHVWQDPANMAAMGRNVAAALDGIGVAADAAGLEQQMTDLDKEFAEALSDCKIEELVTSHEAFAYLASAYGMEQVGISGLSPEAEPSAARMAQVAELVDAKGITTIYFETLVSAGAAEAIAAETGAETALLDPIEGNTDDQGYPAIMRANKDALVAGRSCT